jgi:hypothetical protein
MLRMRVAWRRAELDTALAAGADPSDRDDLALRAQQLIDPRRRARFARALRRAIQSTEPATHLRLPARSAAVPVARAAVLEARPLLLALADDLEELPQLSPRGVALAVALLTNGDGPLYRPSAPAALREAAAHARAAL